MRVFQTFDLVEDELASPIFGVKVRLQRYVNKRGSYIGQRDRGRRTWLIRAIAKLGISPIKRRSGDGACTIGKSSITGKWYGWGWRGMDMDGFATRRAASDFAAMASR